VRLHPGKTLGLLAGSFTVSLINSAFQPGCLSSAVSNIEDELPTAR
jgi:hypothetical protein